MLDRLLTESDVLEAITLGRTRFRELLKAGEFPPPRQVSICRVAWKLSCVQEWIDQRPVADAYAGEVPMHSQTTYKKSAEVGASAGLRLFPSGEEQENNDEY